MSHLASHNAPSSFPPKAFKHAAVRKSIYFCTRQIIIAGLLQSGFLSPQQQGNKLFFLLFSHEMFHFSRLHCRESGNFPAAPFHWSFSCCCSSPFRVTAVTTAERIVQSMHFFLSSSVAFGSRTNSSSQGGIIVLRSIMS